ncbi:MAG: phage tail protein [Anaerolineae bacterium]
MAPPGERIDAYPAFRFAVTFGGSDQAVFSECTLPNLEVDVHEQKEGGYNHGVHLLPGAVKAGRITLKRGLAKSGELLAWYADVASGNAQKALRNVSVVLYDAESNEVLRLNFAGAFPVRWSGPTLRTADSAIAIETLELAFAEVEVG